MQQPQVLFSKAANGQATCTVNGIHLHSAYNPSHEAAAFVSSITCSFTPKYILITAPGLSYCAIPLRKLYPNATLCAVQYISTFAAADHYMWDKVFSLQNTAVPLSEQIYSFMGDEGIVSCLFLSWQPSEKAFPQEYDVCWKEIKNAVLKSRTVLATKSFFARRWTKNDIRFSLFTEHTVATLAGTSPIILCASGPSLYSSIPFIKRFQKYCSIFCVSSAFAPLIAYGIIPDVCISTDGGFWAKRHLSFAVKYAPQTVFAFPPEASSSAALLQSKKILPLKYGDGAGDTILDCCGFRTIQCSRNGTVSGTAALLALNLTSSSVFCCGLDLAPSKGFAHTQPNELELADSLSDTRLSPKELRIVPSTFSSMQLDIYKSWFSTTDFNGRLFRLSNSYTFQNTLGSVKDVDWNFFASTLSKCKDKEKVFFTTTSPSVPSQSRLPVLQRIITSNMSNPVWIREAVPAESVIYERSKLTSNEKTAAKSVDRAMTLFYKDIMRAFGKGSVL